MFRSMRAKWTVRLHVVTITAVIVAVLFSALMIPSEVDHHVPPSHQSLELAADIGGSGDAPAHTQSDKSCHIGHSCLLAIVRSDDLALVGMVKNPERPIKPNYKPSVTGNLLLQPPRTLSQV